MRAAVGWGWVPGFTGVGFRRRNLRDQPSSRPKGRLNFVLEALPAVAAAAVLPAAGFNMANMLETLPGADEAFDMEALAEAMPAAVGVEIPPPRRRDPRERFMERPDGR